MIDCLILSCLLIFYAFNSLMMCPHHVHRSYTISILLATRLHSSLLHDVFHDAVWHHNWESNYISFIPNCKIATVHFNSIWHCFTCTHSLGSSVSFCLSFFSLFFFGGSDSAFVPSSLCWRPSLINERHLKQHVLPTRYHYNYIQLGIILCILTLCDLLSVFLYPSCVSFSSWVILLSSLFCDADDHLRSWELKYIKKYLIYKQIYSSGLHLAQLFRFIYSLSFFLTFFCDSLSLLS